MLAPDLEEPDGFSEAAALPWSHPHLAGPSEAFDAITRLALRLLDVPAVLISMVEEDQDRQYFLSAQGLPEPWSSLRQTPLSHSFCQHVKRTGKPMMVPDARQHPELSSSPAIVQLNAVAYLGVPIRNYEGEVLGAICVLEGSRRDWTDDDLATMKDLALCVNDEIGLRAAMTTADRLNRKLEESHAREVRYNTLRESISLAFMTPDLTIQNRFDQLLRAAASALNMQWAAIAKLDGEELTLLFQHDVASDGACSKAVSATPPQMPCRDTLAGLVMDGESIFYHSTKPIGVSAERANLAGTYPGCYVAAPLYCDGELFGVLELSKPDPCGLPWSNEEQSLLTLVSMFACVHLGMFQQIRALQASEAALLECLIAAKREDSPIHAD